MLKSYFSEQTKEAMWTKKSSYSESLNDLLNHTFLLLRSKICFQKSRDNLTKTRKESSENVKKMSCKERPPFDSVKFFCKFF